MAENEEQNDSVKKQDKPTGEKSEVKSDQKIVVHDQGEKLKHDVVESDELSADIHVNKVTGSQKRLLAMVIAGVVLMMVGGFALFNQLEGASNVRVPVPSQAAAEEEEAEKVLDNYVYATAPGQKSLQQQKIAEESEVETVELKNKSVNLQSNQAEVQLSSNGFVKAVQTNSNTVVVESGENEQEVKISGLVEWLLVPDGTQIYAIVNGGHLRMYNTSNDENREVAKSFSPSGSDVSRLYYSRDGKLRQYAKSGGSLTEATYDSIKDKPDSRKAEVERLTSIGNFDYHSLSPDGTVLVFRANVNGRNTLQLLSLNSFVLRTIFVADTPGGSVADFSWSDDSNNIAINVAGSGKVRLVNLKVGTLEKIVVIEQDGSGSRFESPAWSPEKKYISFTQDNKLKLVAVESNEVTDAIGSVNSQWLSGWFQKQNTKVE